MSTKSSVILTNDNEHIYFDCSTYVVKKDSDIPGKGIVFEFHKKNIELYLNDEDDLCFEITKDSEIYRFFEKIFMEYRFPTK